MRHTPQSSRQGARTPPRSVSRTRSVVRGAGVPIVSHSPELSERQQLPAHVLTARPSPLSVTAASIPQCKPTSQVTSAILAEIGSILSAASPPVVLPQRVLVLSAAATHEANRDRRGGGSSHKRYQLNSVPQQPRSSQTTLTSPPPPPLRSGAPAGVMAERGSSVQSVAAQPPQPTHGHQTTQLDGSPRVAHMPLDARVRIPVPALSFSVAATHSLVRQRRLETGSLPDGAEVDGGSRVRMDFSHLAAATRNTRPQSINQVRGARSGSSVPSCVPSADRTPSCSRGGSIDRYFDDSISATAHLQRGGSVNNSSRPESGVSAVRTLRVGRSLVRAYPASPPPRASGTSAGTGVALASCRIQNNSGTRVGSGDSARSGRFSEGWDMHSSGQQQSADLSVRSSLLASMRLADHMLDTSPRLAASAPGSTQPPFLPPAPSHSASCTADGLTHLDTSFVSPENSTGTTAVTATPSTSKIPEFEDMIARLESEMQLMGSTSPPPPPAAVVSIQRQSTGLRASAGVDANSYGSSALVVTGAVSMQEQQRVERENAALAATLEAMLEENVSIERMAQTVLDGMRPPPVREVVPPASPNFLFHAFRHALPDVPHINNHTTRMVGTQSQAPDHTLAWATMRSVTPSSARSHGTSSGRAVSASRRGVSRLVWNGSTRADGFKCVLPVLRAPATSSRSQPRSRSAPHTGWSPTTPTASTAVVSRRGRNSGHVEVATCSTAISSSVGGWRGVDEDMQRSQPPAGHAAPASVARTWRPTIELGMEPAVAAIDPMTGHTSGVFTGAATASGYPMTESQAPIFPSVYHTSIPASAAGPQSTSPPLAGQQQQQSVPSTDTSPLSLLPFPYSFPEAYSGQNTSVRAATGTTGRLGEHTAAPHPSTLPEPTFSPEPTQPPVSGSRALTLQECSVNDKDTGDTGTPKGGTVGVHNGDTELMSPLGGRSIDFKHYLRQLPEV